jgi:ATP-binding cassette subfamily B protein
MTGWKIARTFIRENRISYLIGVSLTAAASLPAVLVPRQLGLFADKLGKGGIGAHEAAVSSAIIVAICTIRIVLWWLGCRVILRKGRLLTYQLRKRLFDKWTGLSAEYYQKQSTGDLLSHALSDVEVIREMASMELCMTISGLSMLATAVCMMVILGDWRLTAAALGPLLAIPLLVKALAPGLKQLSSRCQKALGGMTQTAEEIFSGIRAVKAFGNERVVFERFAGKVDAIVHERLNFVRQAALFEALIPLLANLSFVAVLGYGGYLCMTGVITIGGFIAFSLYVAMLRNPLVHLGKTCNLAQRCAVSLNRIAALLEAVPAVRNRESLPADVPVRGELRVEKLNFRYPGSGQDVLCDISFTLAPGETLGIIGQMGSGKTTLADLLLRLYDPPEGAVFIDGRDILDYPIEALRRAMAYAPQDGFLFSTTILENISFSDESANPARAEKTAITTDLHETITRFPDGYGTEVGERGVCLSGGQKQRLAVARMIYKEAPFRIMDDCLSAVDTATERHILKNLAHTEKGTGADRPSAPQSTIIISHRLNAVRHADEILVLEKGHIVERGKHDDLVLKNGPYASMWRIQAGGAGAGSGEASVGIRPVAAHESDRPGTGFEERSFDETESEIREEERHAGGLRTLLRYSGAQSGPLVLAFLLVITVMLIEMAQPYLIREVIDHYITVPRPDAGAAFLMVGVYLATVLFAFALTFRQEIALQNPGIMIVRALRTNLFAHLQGLSLRYFDRHSVGRVITNLVNDTEAITRFFSHFLPVNLRGFISLAVIMIFMLELDVSVALRCFILIPLIALISFCFRIRLRAVNNQIRNCLSRVVSFLAENLSGMSLIQIFQQESKQKRKFDERNISLRDATERENHAALLLNCTSELLGDVALAALVWFGGCSVAGGTMSIGVLYAFIGYTRQFFRPINSITQQLNVLQPALVATERIASAIRTEPEVLERPGATPPMLRGMVRFDRVSFAYARRLPVLDGISLTIPAGSKTGFVGASGAGKTTLMNLVARFYDVTEGAVQIDGKDVREWPLEDLRNVVGIVQQDVTLFVGSIIDNVRFFREDIPVERVREACRLVGAEQFILHLPNGYDTVLPERGSSLSYGERQLLSLARVLVFDPRILILDEATAGLDPKTESTVREAVHRVSLGRTLMVIAHRLSTVRDMDTIVVLDRGRVVETGTHTELMQKQGYYRYLYLSGNLPHGAAA